MLTISTAAKVKQLLLLTGVTIKRQRSKLTIANLLRLAIALIAARTVARRLL